LFLSPLVNFPLSGHETRFFFLPYVDKLLSLDFFRPPCYISHILFHVGGMALSDPNMFKVVGMDPVTVASFPLSFSTLCPYLGYLFVRFGRFVIFAGRRQFSIFEGLVLPGDLCD